MNIESLVGEIWKRIPGFDGYEASNMGRVRSFKVRGSTHISSVPQRILAQATMKRSGYKFVGLRANKKSYTRRIHRLVMEAFVGKRPPGMEVCHNDGNPENNILENLRYDTHAMNMMDAVKQGRMGHSTAQKSNAGKKTILVTRIRSEYQGGPGEITSIASKYHMSRGAIRNILTGKTYKRVAGKIHTLDRCTKIKENDASEIRRLWQSGLFSIQDIAHRYLVSGSTIRVIVHNKRCYDPNYMPSIRNKCNFYGKYRCRRSVRRGFVCYIEHKK